MEMCSSVLIANSLAPLETEHASYKKNTLCLISLRVAATYPGNEPVSDRYCLQECREQPRFRHTTAAPRGKRAFPAGSGSARPTMKPRCESGVALRESTTARPVAALHHEPPQ